MGLPPSSTSMRAGASDHGSQDATSDGTLMIEGHTSSGCLFGVEDHDLKRQISEQMELDFCHIILLRDSRSEIIALFYDRGLPVAAAFRLTDPEKEYDFEDLPTFAEFVTESDLRATGLKVATARKLLRDLRRGGAIYTKLVLSNRLVPSAGSPNDGMLSNDQTNSSDCTDVHVPRDVKERIHPVAKQLHVQEILARTGVCGEILCDASHEALNKGTVDGAEHSR
ncbi:unnamed protein product, partial [Polarella glacialis]